MIKQRSAPWFEQRKGMITGSRVGAILGLSPFQKPADVLRAMVRDYHGAEPEFTGNAATEYGTFHEEYAQADFEMATGDTVQEVGFCVHPEHEWLGASPDGLVGDDHVIEIKCPFGKRYDTTPTFKPIVEQQHYYAQVQIEMACTGREKCFFFQWNRHVWMLDVVYYSQQWMDDNLPRLKSFFDHYQSEINNPEHLEELVREIPDQVAADEYIIAKADFDAAKEKLDKAKSALIDLAGGKKSKISGLLVYPIERKGSISYAKLVKEHCPDVDVEPYRGKGTKSWAVK